MLGEEEKLDDKWSQTKMKILIICPDWFPSISGFGTSAYEFAKRAEKNHEVTILTPSQKNLDKKGLDVRPVPQLFNVLGRNPIVVGLLNKINRADYDVILLYSYMYEMNARVAMWHRLGLIKKPVILMYRGSLENYVLKHLSLPIKAGKIVIDNTFGAAAFRCSDYIISNSKPTLRVINERYNIPFGKMTYIPNSINLADYKQSRLDNKRVLFIGRLIQNKGVRFFDKIAQNIPKNWTFTIVGDGPMEDFVLKLKNKYRNIDYRGRLTRAQTNKIITASDILILPTFAEGSPRAVLEASASGVPSIAFDVGDVSTLLDNNMNGYTIPRYDIDDFIAKMKKLIADESLRKKKGLSASKYAKKNLSWETNLDLMISEIKKVVRNYPGAKGVKTKPKRGKLIKR
jgi:glycosyltransferase involved in cell wall biosynthesis